MRRFVTATVAVLAFSLTVADVATPASAQVISNLMSNHKKPKTRPKAPMCPTGQKACSSACIPNATVCHPS